MFVIPNNIEKQILISRPTRFGRIQEKVRYSSCKYVDDRSPSNIFPLIRKSILSKFCTSNLITQVNVEDRQTDNACLFYMANEKTQRPSKSADHGKRQLTSIIYLENKNLL